MTVDHYHPVFHEGARVALVQAVTRKGRFGVAMQGGRYVVPLPDGYDGETRVHWVDGWIIVQREGLPPLLADTTTGTTSPMNEHAMAAAARAYVAPAANRSMRLN